MFVVFLKRCLFILLRSRRIIAKCKKGLKNSLGHSKEKPWKPPKPSLDHFNSIFSIKMWTRSKGAHFFLRRNLRRARPPLALIRFSAAVRANERDARAAEGCTDFCLPRRTAAKREHVLLPVFPSRIVFGGPSCYYALLQIVHCVFSPIVLAKFKIFEQWSMKYTTESSRISAFDVIIFRSRTRAVRWKKTGDRSQVCERYNSPISIYRMHSSLHGCIVWMSTNILGANLKHVENFVIYHRTSATSLVLWIKNIIENDATSGIIKIPFTRR